MLRDYPGLSRAQILNLMAGTSGSGPTSDPRYVLSRYDTPINEITIEHGLSTQYVVPTVYTLTGYLLPDTAFKSILTGINNDDQKYIRIIFVKPFTGVIRISV